MNNPVVVGTVCSIWRYPILGLQGEELHSATITKCGVENDRKYALIDQEVHGVIDATRWKYAWGETIPVPRMLEMQARIPPNVSGVITTLPDGTRISSSDPKHCSSISDFLNRDVSLVEVPEVMNDKSKRGRAIHLITTSSLTQLERSYPLGNFNPKRFRPNLVVQTSDELSGFAEERWIGSCLKIGEKVKLQIQKKTDRCSMTTMKQGEISRDLKILETLRQNNNALGVLCSVTSRGVIEIGDEVNLLVTD